VIAGVVLAAGRSSRMGSPKALLDYRGGTFLQRIVRALLDGGCDRVVVVTGPRTDDDSDRIATAAEAAGAEVVVNPDRDSQQIESLRIALGALPLVDGVLMSPVDSPGFGPAVVAALIGALASGAPIALPEHGGRRGHPVAFGASVLPDLRTGDLPQGARTVLHRHAESLVEVPVDDPAVLLDVDTPADYHALRSGR
jgi:CTP:molybdopterin cytidylyltransferase MocA